MNLLEGIKIIDFTRLLPGPVATHLLAQMGAEVIKIESPQRLDYARFAGQPVDGASLFYHQLNHNKTPRTVDYETEEGRMEALGWIEDADVLIEQFRPGTMEAWGFGYEALKKVNPGLVYASITGYGQNNPYEAEAGHDINYLAYSGLLSLLKDEDGKPQVPGFQLADVGGAYMAVMALQAALIRKTKTGEGCFVDVSLADAAMPFLSFPFAMYSEGLDHEQFNFLNGKTAVNYATYACADGQWIAMGALELKFWNRFCELVEKPEWKRDHQPELYVSQFPKEEVEALFKTRSRDEWITFFKGQDVCITPVLALNELQGHDYHQSKQSFGSHETPSGREVSTVKLPFQVR